MGPKAEPILEPTIVPELEPELKPMFEPVDESKLKLKVEKIFKPITVPKFEPIIKPKVKPIIIKTTVAVNNPCVWNCIKMSQKFWKVVSSQPRRNCIPPYMVSF